MKSVQKCPHCGKEVEVNIYAESFTSDEYTSKNKDVGFVYVVYSPSNDLYKIGRSKRVDDRYGTIAKQSPVPIELVYSFESINASRAEKTLHRKFSGSRVRGEWFNLSQADLDFIKAIKDRGL